MTLGIDFKIKPGLAGLTQEHIEIASKESIKQNLSVYKSLIKLGFVDENKVLQEIAQKTGSKLKPIDSQEIQDDAVEKISANIASHYGIMPVKMNGNQLWVAMSDPFNQELKHELEVLLDRKYEINFLLAKTDEIKNSIRKYYGLGAATVEKMVSSDEFNLAEDINSDLKDDVEAREASVMKLVNQILADAISATATDIHIEPFESDLKIRYRIDGIMHDAGMPESVKHFKDGIVSRIKIMSNLDIAEKRVPQDGRAQVNLNSNTFDLRISILPCRYGEAANIRILPRGTTVSDLGSLGFPQRSIDTICRLINKPHGIVLVTGPTGSGKTTTLYTCMNLLNDGNKKIITIEDPIEYDMFGLVQMQVQSEIGFTFSRALRSMLRHDPDVMLVGEIRDLETAETAIRTSLTGHLVFSTLHTNSAAAAITRLQDMGLEPFLVASSVEAIVAQRLIRTICPKCKQEHEPEPEILLAIKSLSGLEKLPTVYKGKGCPYCRFTGYHGRTVITELLLMSEMIREMTIKSRPAPLIQKTAINEGMSTLFESGIGKVHEGISTYEELLRVTGGAI